MATAFAAGLAKGEDGREVGQHAADRALTDLDDDRADFALVFSSAAYDYREVAAGVESVVGDDVKLLGASTAGEFTHERASRGGVSVGVLSSDKIEVYTGIGEGLDVDEEAAIAEAAADFPTRVEGYPHRTGIMLQDGMIHNGSSATFTVIDELGMDIDLAGGAAGDDLDIEETHVFDGDRTVTGGVGLALLVSKEPIPIAVDHGHEPISDPLEVTASDGATVTELDGRPAFEVWKDEVRERTREDDVDVDELEGGTEELASTLLQFEFGLETPEGYKIRSPAPTNTTDGPIQFLVNVPEGSVLRVMNSGDESQIEASKRATRSALDKLGDADPAGGIVFDCVCRAEILGDRFDQAIDGMAEELQPLVGFETYGELCMQTGEKSGYHNATSVVLVLPD